MAEPEKSVLNKEILAELMIANLKHARHVENERLSFNSIYIAVVAGFFALAFDFANPLLTMFFIGILLIISIIGFLFTKRWSDVFDEHSRKAQQIALLLYGDEAANEGEELVNKYYYFNHDYRRHTVAVRLDKLRRKEAVRTRREGREPRAVAYAEAEAEINFHSAVHRLCVIRTRTLFYLFYGIVVSVLAIFFIYSVWQLIARW